ncbi:hypothetical protein BJ322DRAFT_247860 [Thelephora terrestris]|uniref:Uncharacterized protein n=1 Tax=Thelephora terrestris TaxID=56493 RepID=A0A9P6HA80_9AGAM|nr:hypothetical protein BJ322DRAFT_247860 [Thelephora terrestris]
MGAWHFQTPRLIVVSPCCYLQPTSSEACVAIYVSTPKVRCERTITQLLWSPGGTRNVMLPHHTFIFPLVSTYRPSHSH